MIHKLIKKILRALNLRPISIEELKARGLHVGANFYSGSGGQFIDAGHVHHIFIGDNVTLATGVHILAHDTSTKYWLGYTKVKNTKVGNNVFIGAGSIVLPGVTIGNNVIIGSASVITKNIPSDCVAAGNPAKVLCPLEIYLEKEKASFLKSRCFDERYTFRNKDFNTAMREEMTEACERDSTIYLK